MSLPAHRLLVLTALLGCASPPTTAAPTAPEPTTKPSPPVASAAPEKFVLPPDMPATTSLHAIYAGPARVQPESPDEIKITIENVGTKPEELNLFVLDIQQLALDVFDAQGHR